VQANEALSDKCIPGSPGNPAGCTGADPEDLHEYVSFEDPEEDRTWVFDVTFFLSNWTCIYGQGCQGVLTGPAPELVQGCCSYGAHFIDDDDVATVEAAAARLTNEQWQFRRKGRKGGFLRTQDEAQVEKVRFQTERYCRLAQRHMAALRK